MEKPKQADYDPLCPHCDKPVQQLNVHRSISDGFFGMKLPLALGVFSCPHCQRILGIATKDEPPVD